MKPKVIIYGTETCPFVKKASEAYGDRAIYYALGHSTKQQPMDWMALSDLFKEDNMEGFHERKKMFKLQDEIIL